MPAIFKVVNPLGEPVSEPAPLAPRLDTLNGKTVGEIWNGAYEGQTTFHIIEEMLRERHPGVIESGWDTPKEWADLGPTDTVPVMGYPGLIEVVVCGDPNRNKAMTLHSVYNRRVSKAISLPADWETLMRGFGR